MSSADTVASEWLSAHVHYHGDADLLLRRGVDGWVRRLLADGLIDRFFFVRYALGGPHVRLRVRPTSRQARRRVRAAVEAGAAAFFSSHPSAASLPPAEVRRRNRAILASDPGEEEDQVFSDNSLRWAPFRPETLRYGGPTGLRSSLEYFSLSSSVCLQALALRAVSGLRALPQALHLLAAQASGFATTTDELSALLGYASEPPGSGFDPVVRRAQEVAARRAKELERIVTGACEGRDARDAAKGALLARGAALLRGEVDQAAPDALDRIGRSQLHMTANRLGLGNVEELYASRLLAITAHRMAAARARSWARWEERLEPKAYTSRGEPPSDAGLSAWVGEQLALHAKGRNGAG